MKNIEEWTVDLHKYRQKHFTVEVRQERDAIFGEFVLSVTHNGRQWQALGLLPKEARAVIKALREYLNGKQLDPGLKSD